VLSYGDKDVIANGMTQRIIDFFKAIEIKQRNMKWSPRCRHERLSKALVKCGAIIETSQTITLCCMLLSNLTLVVGRAVKNDA